VASLVDKQVAVARVWADALFTLAAGAGKDDDLRAELEELVALIDAEPRLGRLLASPLVDDDAKARLIERMLRGKASDLLVDALQILRRKGRLDLVRAVAQVYREEWLRRKNHVEVRVATAVPLTDDLRQELRLAAAERTNRHPILVETVDPQLLGGVVIRIGDQKYDGSVARELERLESLVLARASLELLSGKSYFTEGI
jgi:F-type H+-transporting ATPase subunit delta